MTEVFRLHPREHRPSPSAASPGDTALASPRDEKRRRELVLEQCLASLGKNWACSYFQEMSLASRKIEGGWPGRLGEARALVLRELAQALAVRGMDPPSALELASAPSAVNDHARTEWTRAGRAQRVARREAR